MFNPRWYLLEGVERLRRFGTRGELRNPVVKRDLYYFRDLRPVVVDQAPEAAARLPVYSNAIRQFDAPFNAVFSAQPFPVIWTLGGSS